MGIYSVIWASSEQAVHAAEIQAGNDEIDAADRLYERLREAGHKDIITGNATRIVAPKKVRPCSK